MQCFIKFKQLLRFSTSSIIIATQLLVVTPGIAPQKAAALTTCQSKQPKTNFIAFGGGGDPSSNEIALEKNILYFQRTLRTLGYNPTMASIFFANGKDKRRTIRYIDKQGNQQFKASEIPNLHGAATLNNLETSIQNQGKKTPNKPIFFYFTGHGFPNQENINNNSLVLWNEQPLSVQKFSQILDKLPTQTPVVTMMAQCFSGSFANFIYQDGNPKRPLALQTRCGFFATIKTRPSVGCTAEVNEYDYRDYSSSFFAGLSGKNRLNQVIPSTDYNKDGRVSYIEAHAFAKVDDKSIDLPISTSEAWLQYQAYQKDVDSILIKPINQQLQQARPEQKYVINSLVKVFDFDIKKPFSTNLDSLSNAKVNTEEKEAELRRLAMELVNVGMENKIRTSNNKQAIIILDRLIKCENGSL